MDTYINKKVVGKRSRSR